jgi:hypothetical protein
MYYPEPKKKLAISEILDIFIRLVTIAAVIAPVIGYFIIFDYLLGIDQLSFFTEILSSPTSFLVIGYLFVWMYLIISSPLLLPIILFESKKKINNTKNYSKLVHIIEKNTNRLETIVYFVYGILSIAILCCYFIFDTQIENYFIFPIVLFLYFIMLLSLSILFYYKETTKQEKDRQKNSLIWLSILSFIILFLSLFIQKGLSNSMHLIILNSSRLIETPRNSSWYLLHNNFQPQNGTQETNGINKNDLKKMKEIFKCSSIPKYIQQFYEIKCETNPEKRNNALYGYMAWNMGDTKVFCPASVNNFRTDTEDKTDLKSCIVISGKALQIMPEDYISTNTDGIDDGNPENTGHDNPAIDINTDVRFKNDLNAQSNAGLNNFNVQPVLPIQSNAKNMSIQIHYGSCNHDSPRNKDGHPDIGYTDKKICQ